MMDSCNWDWKMSTAGSVHEPETCPTPLKSIVKMTFWVAPGSQSLCEGASPFLKILEHLMQTGNDEANDGGGSIDDGKPGPPANAW